MIYYYTMGDGDVNVCEFTYSAPSERKELKPQVRDMYFLHFVLSGVCHFCDFEVPAGSAFFTSIDKLLSFYVEPGYSHFVFGFKGKGVPELFDRYGLTADRHMLIEVSDFEYLTSTLKNAFSAAEHNAKIATSAFYSVFPLLKVKGRVQSKENRIAETAKKFIDNNYQNHITISDVAKYVYISEKYLCHRFKQSFSVTPQQYLLSVRMKKAKTLLKSSELKIKEISVSVGYKSQLTFSYAFKNHVGISPSEYREGIS